MNIIIAILSLIALLCELLKRNRQNKVEQQLKHIAHDIRSPLAVLDANNNYDIKDDITKFAINRIEELATGIITQEEENQKNKITSFKVKFILQQIIETKKIQYKNLNINFKLKGKDITVFAEKTEFISVISNIINNAVEAIGVTGKITIKLIKNKYSNQIVISDNGPGFDKEIINGLGKVTLSTKPNGNGLGLYNAFHALKAWNGSIDIKSTHKGSSIILSFAKVKMVLVDDDDLVHLNWETLARRKKCTLLTCKSFNEFNKNDISKNIPIYIDQNLKQGPNGLAIAKELYKRGYTDLHLVTGDTTLKESSYNFLKSISNKCFPQIDATI